jgi:superfamily II DNA or RNA helicase
LKDNSANTLKEEIAEIESRLAELDNERASLDERLKSLQAKLREALSNNPKKTVQVVLSPEEKIHVFRDLFRGREDVYPKLWTSKKTGAKGYSPFCLKEWQSGICRKPTVKCSECNHRAFAPVTDSVIRQHLDGQITAGVYPLLEDDTCWFLAVDFDKKEWAKDATAFLVTCKANTIPAYLERSRSGNGGHVWVFFNEPVPAALARQLGEFLITETMEARSELDMKSYDRLFPNQDTLPKGGFGNLIALPLQKVPREAGNSVFVDETLTPNPDQWAILANVSRISLPELTQFLKENIKIKGLLGIRKSQIDEETAPWENQSLSERIFKKLTCALPDLITVVMANRLYIKKDGLPSQLITRIKRLASFQNPEFFKKQSMRFSTAKTPRVICCADEIDSFVAIPRGCLDDLAKLLSINEVNIAIDDKRVTGEPTDFAFQGELNPLQERALKEMLKNDTGVFVAPPGVGKTVLGIKLIAKRQVNTLVLVHRKPLLDQWRAQIASFFDMDVKKIGQIGGAKDKATGVIDVAMLQSMDKEDGVDDRIRQYGQIIVDECHHISAVSFERVMMAASARYVAGLTATPYRRDGHQPIIIMQCGPIRYSISTRSVAKEAAFRQVLIERQTDFSCEWTEGDHITAIWALLIADDARNDLICKDVFTVLSEGRSPIILTERKEHLELLKGKLEESVEHLVVLHGGMRAPRRREMLQKLFNAAETEPRVILATGPYIGEGFDDPRLDTLFLAMPFSFKGKMVQYAGRLHRQRENKKEIRIYDYVDSKMPIFEKMCGFR